jgi:hypothetical protein
MNQEDRAKIQSDLFKFERQLENYLLHKEEYQSLIEELNAQRETNPDDQEIKDELLKAYLILSKKEEVILDLIEKIKTIEWLLA